MESLVSGLPTLCAGYGYGGPVTPENLGELLRANLTGRGLPPSVDSCPSDLANLVKEGRRKRSDMRDYLSVDRFVSQLLADIGAT